jgi:hypothetical protein
VGVPGRVVAEAACPGEGRRGCWGPSAAVQSAAARKSVTETHRRRSAAEPEKEKKRKVER